MAGETYHFQPNHSSSASMDGLKEPPAWISALLLALLLIFPLFLRRRREEATKTKLPPAPPKLPIISRLHQQGELHHVLLRDLSQKHGPLMLLQLDRVPTIVVSSAHLAQEILRTHDADFVTPALISAKKMMHSEHWRHVRRSCMLELLSNKRVQSFRSVREEEVAGMLRTILNSNDYVVNMSDMFVSITSEIACRIVLGKNYFGRGGECRRNSLSPTGRGAPAFMGAFHFGDFFPCMEWIDVLTGIEWRQKKNFQGWDGFLDLVIQEHFSPRRDGNEYQDFVDILLRLEDQSTLGIPITRDDIKAIILDMIAAGADTSSKTVESAMAELVKNPEVMKKAQEEVRRIVGRKLKVEESDIHQMDYLKSIIKEAMRLHPPTPLLAPRLSIKDTKIQGYVIPAKTRVHINIWAIGRDPTSWERAEEFHPERFVNTSTDFKGDDFSFIPFGAGENACPGTSFAIPIIELVLANLLYLFDWKLPDGEMAKDLDVAEWRRHNVYQKLALLLVATPHFV